MILIDWLFIRADEWNVNKWAWEGSLKVISKGEECIIRLEDKTTGDMSLEEKEKNATSAVVFFILQNFYNLFPYLKIGELYARAFLRDGEPHPVEPVIDSSRFNKQSFYFFFML